MFVSRGYVLMLNVERVTSTVEINVWQQGNQYHKICYDTTLKQRHINIDAKRRIDVGTTLF